MTHTITEQPSLAAIIHDLRESYARTSPGTWGKGATTHETVSRAEGREPYKVAEFRHANDAQFCDLAHVFVPRLLSEIEALQSRVQEVEATNTEVEKLKVKVKKLRQQLITEAKKAAEEKLRADQLDKQHSMQSRMHAEVNQKLIAKPATSAAAQVLSEPVPGEMKPVNAGALQMVINALHRDAEEGKVVRGEMADELLATVGQVPKTDTYQCRAPQGYVRPQEPDSHDGHDYEGFIGGCQRMRCKASVADVDVGIPITTSATMSDAQIKAVFLANGFTIKEGMTDLKPYVYQAARALLAAHAAQI